MKRYLWICVQISMILAFHDAPQNPVKDGNQIPVRSPGTFDDTNLYKIHFNEDDDPSLPESVAARIGGKDPDILALNEEEEMDNILWLKTKNGEAYYCVLPSVPGTSEDSSSESTESKLKVLSPYELLKPLIDREVCSYRLEQYWTYELCHGRYLRQFHEESAISKTPNQEYILGKFDAATQLTATEKEFTEKLSQLKEQGKNHPTVTVEGKVLPYIEFNFTQGSLCDLSGKPRVTRVLYVCTENSKHELHSIKETFSCEYEAIVLSPMLCIHDDYQIQPVTEDVIRCFPVNGSPSKPKDMKEFEAGIRAQSKPETLFDGKTIIFEAAEIGPSGVRLQVHVHDPAGNEFDRLGFARGKPADIPRISHNTLSPKDSILAAEFMDGSYCLHGGTGWWRHEFCYGRKIEQYHEVNGERKQSIILGRWNPEKHVEWLSKHPEKRPRQGKTPKMVYHFYGDGDVCEETGKPRTVEVKIKCKYAEGHQIDTVALYLLEPQTCEYILGVESPIFCHLLNTIDSNGLIEFTPSNLPSFEKKEVDDKELGIDTLIQTLLQLDELQGKKNQEKEAIEEDDEDPPQERKHRVVKKDLGNARDEL